MTTLPKTLHSLTSTSFRRSFSSTAAPASLSLPKPPRNHRAPPHKSLLYTTKGVEKEFKPRGSKPSTEDGLGAPYHAGPYPVGAGLGASGFGRQAVRKPWGQLGWGSKIYRIGANSSNLAVVALGGTLFFIIAISVSTELFSPNSTTVMFGKAVDKLKEQDELKHYLLPPYTYHPPQTTSSSSRTTTTSSRYRLSSFPSHIFVDPRTGRETHSFIFLVEGQEPGSFRSHTGWWGSWRDWALEEGGKGWAEAKRLAGEAQGSMRENGWLAPVDEEAEKASAPVVGEKESAGWGLGSLFGFKRGDRAMDPVRKRGLPPPGKFTHGECHVVCEKNHDSNRLELKSMQVFIPSSTARRPYSFSVPVQATKPSWLDVFFSSKAEAQVESANEGAIELLEDVRDEIREDVKEIKQRLV